MYISITGLTLRHWWDAPRFWFHAMPSYRQAASAPGNISTHARTINGVRHTVTVWENEDAMRRFIYSGAHACAIKVFSKIATGRTFGFDRDTVRDWPPRNPDWITVHQLWLDHAQSYE